MATSVRQKSKNRAAARHRSERLKKQRASVRKRPDPNSNAVPFRVSAVAAKLLGPPAISDAREEKLPFDSSKAQRAVKTKPA
jgi:hypothetical protein